MNRRPPTARKLCYCSYTSCSTNFVFCSQGGVRVCSGLRFGSLFDGAVRAGGFTSVLQHHTECGKCGVRMLVTLAELVSHEDSCSGILCSHTAGRGEVEDTSACRTVGSTPLARNEKDSVQARQVNNVTPVCVQHLPHTSVYQELPPRSPVGPSVPATKLTQAG